MVTWIFDYSKLEDRLFAGVSYGDYVMSCNIDLLKDEDIISIYLLDTQYITHSYLYGLLKPIAQGKTYKQLEDSISIEVIKTEGTTDLEYCQKKHMMNEDLKRVIDRLTRK